MSAELATAYIRIRAILDDLKPEIQAGATKAVEVAGKEAAAKFGTDFKTAVGPPLKEAGVTAAESFGTSLKSGLVASVSTAMKDATAATGPAGQEAGQRFATGFKTPLGALSRTAKEAVAGAVPAASEEGRAAGQAFATGFKTARIKLIAPTGAGEFGAGGRAAGTAFAAGMKGPLVAAGSEVAGAGKRAGAAFTTSFRESAKAEPVAVTGDAALFAAAGKQAGTAFKVGVAEATAGAGGSAKGALAGAASSAAADGAAAGKAYVEGAVKPLAELGVPVEDALAQAVSAAGPAGVTSGTQFTAAFKAATVPLAAAVSDPVKGQATTFTAAGKASGTSFTTALKSTLDAEVPVAVREAAGGAPTAAGESAGSRFAAAFKGPLARLRGEVKGSLGGAPAAAAESGAVSGRSFSTAFKSAAIRLVGPGAFTGVAAAAAGEGKVAGLAFSRGLQRETESHAKGLGHHLTSILGLAFGVGLGAEFGIRFTKELVNSAATVQKSAEVIKSSFGKQAGEVLVKFGDTTAAKLGISAEAADATSARFGILFKNLGVGVPTAARMTIGLEKLAGALSTIRGVDPAIVLKNIPLAIAGNLRSLKQLGIATDQNQIKLAAWKLGLTSSIKDGLTPGVRAQAIYAIATAHLGEFLQQAAKHSKDAASVQRRLSAEWSNSKDIIGTAMLPTWGRWNRELADWLGRMNKSGKLQKDVNGIMHGAGQIIGAVKDAWNLMKGPLESVIGLLGGTKRAFELLLAAMVIKKIVGVGLAIEQNLVNAGIRTIGPAAEANAGAYTGAMGEMKLATIGLGATIKSVLITTGIGALVVAASIAALEIIQHWSTVKRWLQEFGDWIKGHLAVALAVPIIGEMVFATVEIIKHWQAVKDWIVKFAGDLKDLFVHPINGIKALFGDLVKAVKGMFSTLGGDVLLLIGEPIVKLLQLLSKIPTKFKVFGKTIGFGNPFGGLADSLQGEIDKLKAAAKSAGDASTGIWGQLGDTTAAAVKHAGRKVKKAVEDTSTTVNTTVKDAAASVPSIGNTIADKLFNQGVASAIAAAGQRLRDALKAQTQQVSKGQQEMAKTILTWNDKINKAANDAQANLGSIADKLIAQVDKFLTAGGGTKKLTGPLEEQFKRLKKELSAGGITPDLEHALTNLTSQIQGTTAKGFKDITARKALVQKTIADLANDFNKGVLSGPKMKSKLDAFFKQQGLTPAAAKKLLGSAFADKLEGLVHGMTLQAKAIAKEPADLRRRTRGGSDAGNLPKIIDPLIVIASAHKHISAEQLKIMQQNQRAAERVTAARHHQSVTVQREHLRVAAHHAAEVKRANKAQAKAAVKAAKAAKTAKAASSLDLNTAGFPSSSAKAHGNAARGARATSSKLKH